MFWTAVQSEAPLGFAPLLLKMGVILAFVCGAAYIFLKYILPRLGLAKHQQQSQHIQILSQRALDPKKRLWVVQVGERYFLLGSADGAVNKIAELDAKDIA